MLSSGPGIALTMTAACASVISQQLILTIHSHLFNMHDSLVDKTELHMTGITVRFQAVFIVNHKFPTEQLDYTHKWPFLSDPGASTA